jgi:hypothetical protein
MNIIAFLSFILLYTLNLNGQEARIWMKHEIQFQSDKTYNNPVYDVRYFRVTFTSPSEKKHIVNGFWDGGKNWKVRFCPDEEGTWKWKTECSDTINKGINNKEGVFECIANNPSEEIYRRGSIVHQKGKYYLSYSDGRPFFWLACTAWNGALKSGNEEWDFYLEHRKQNNYNVIQFVTTQWRGCDKNAEGMAACEGSGHLRINPEFFKRIDEKIDKINEHGLIASPVILWALPTGAGRDLSPGYYLPVDEAVLLANYIVARYQGNQVIWTLGGDGRYYGVLEDRWKEIGRLVFSGIDHAPVTLHPHGSSYIGDLYAAEDWYDIMAYQSSHNNGEKVVNWINKGPMSQNWYKLRPLPYINMEPNYEEINFIITDKDVRNASYWSIFATPVAGVTYGANGIWPWLAEGEEILNHRNSKGVSSWRKSINFPGSTQMGYLCEFINRFDWWKLFPANELLLYQPGDDVFNHWVSVVSSDDKSTILAYIPAKGDIELRNPENLTYFAKWFNPVKNSFTDAKINQTDGIISVKQEFQNDMIIVLTKKEFKP